MGMEIEGGNQRIGGEEGDCFPRSCWDGHPATSCRTLRGAGWSRPQERPVAVGAAAWNVWTSVQVSGCAVMQAHWIQ